ncbi:hypothetical protein HDU76_002060 [Blyttiomyces sp. JEL0837]|nr:hypothetical protein HDU76_002060 [Blyttiomyces sp. JEL0837]
MQIAWLTRKPQRYVSDDDKKEKQGVSGTPGLVDEKDLGPLHAALQIYDLNIKDILEQAPSETTQPNQQPQSWNQVPSLKASLRSGKRIDGRIHLMSLAKHSSPHPAMGFLYYKTEGESVSYFMHVVRVPGVPEYRQVDGSESESREMQGKELQGMEAYAFSRDCKETSLPGSCDCFQQAKPTDDNYWSCTNVEEPGIISSIFELPGNMWINKMSLNFRGDVVYARELDRSLFRMIESKDIQGLTSEKLAPKLSIAGPTYEKSELGSALALIELYSSGEGKTVMDIRYKSIDDDEFIFYMRILHKPSPDAPWKEQTLVRSRESLKPNTEDEPAPVDEYYFITNPIIGVSRDLKTCSFVYRSTLFTLDYLGESTPQTVFGYILTETKVRSLEARELRIRGAIMSDSARSLITVTDTNTIIKFTRPNRTQPYHIPASVKPSDPYRPSIFEVPNEINSFYDASMEVRADAPSVEKGNGNHDGKVEGGNNADGNVKDQGILDKNDDGGNLKMSEEGKQQHQQQQPDTAGTGPVDQTGSGSLLSIYPRRVGSGKFKGTWSVDMVWNAELVGEASVSTASIVSMALMPSGGGTSTGSRNGGVGSNDDDDDDSKGDGNDVDEEPRILALLWGHSDHVDNCILILLDLSETYEGSFFYAFIAERWPMILSMVIVTVMFGMNELR